MSGLKQNSNLIERGGVWDEGTTEHLLGMEFSYLDVDHAAADNVKPPNSSQTVKAKLVKSDSGTPLLPGRAVKFSTSAYGTVISGYAGAGEIADGVVDEFAPATGITKGQLFLIVIDGPTEMVSDGSGVLAAGDVLVTAANGKVKKQATSPADEAATVVQINSRVGRAMNGATNVDGTRLRAYFRAP